jgi:iron only hydrogenase large subunit-like protein
MTGNNLPNPEVYQTRGFKHFKEATLRINNRSIHIAAVHGIDNFELLLKKIQSKKVHYDYVEIMACEGGCIGGGGQPVRATVQGRRKRADGLYVIDSKMPVRFAHDNLILQKVYKNYLNSNASIKKICHTTYTKKHKRKSTTAIP